MHRAPSPTDTVVLRQGSGDVTSGDVSPSPGEGGKGSWVPSAPAAPSPLDGFHIPSPCSSRAQQSSARAGAATAALGTSITADAKMTIKEW